MHLLLSEFTSLGVVLLGTVGVVQGRLLAEGAPGLGERRG